MGKILVRAEKPSVGKDIANVLKCKNEKNGYIEGDKYIVTWALGHLVTLADPEGYNSKYKEWKMEDLPIIPKYLKTVVIKKSGKQYQKVKTLLERNDVSEIVIATDAGREGELVARWIIEKSGVKKPVKRLWISSNTDKAIKEGFTKLESSKKYEREGELVARWIIEKSGVKKPVKRLWISSNTDKAIKEGFTKLESSKKYDRLYDSALARAEADWIIGINATRALTVKYNAQLSCGRVQTPTLNMVMKREEEIKDFEPKKFYGIEVKVKKAGSIIKLNWKNNKGNTSVFNEEVVDKIINKIKGNDAEVKKYSVKTKKNYSPQLYDLNEIQRDANKIYGYSAKETLSTVQSLYAEVKKYSVKTKKNYSPQLYDLNEIQRDANKIYGYSAKETLSTVQSLYERHKLLTYPRTDSRYISSDIVDTLKDRVKAVNIGDYRKVASEILKRKIKVSLLTYPRTDSRYISSDIVDTLKDRVKAVNIGDYRKVASEILKRKIKVSKSFVDDSKVVEHYAIIPTEERAFLNDLTTKERNIYDLVIKRFLSVLYDPEEYDETSIECEIAGEKFTAKFKNIKKLGWKELYLF